MIKGVQPAKLCEADIACKFKVLMHNLYVALKAILLGVCGLTDITFETE